MPGRFPVRVTAVLICVLSLGGCISFLAASNVDLADRIQASYRAMTTAAEESGIDVADVVTNGADPESEVEQLLLEANTIAANARDTREKSIRLDKLNIASLDRAALQQTALDSFSDDLDEFTQAAAWTASEIEKLAVVDQKILALDGYTSCGGSAIGDVKCFSDSLNQGFSVVAGLSQFFAGISIPGGQVLGIFSLGIAVAAEIDKEVKRGSYFGERAARIRTIELIARNSLMPGFANLKASMSSALNGLPADLQPAGWRGKLAAAEGKMQAFMDFIGSMEGRFEALKIEEQEKDAQQWADFMNSNLSLEEIAAAEEERNAGIEARAFSRFWAEAGNRIETLQSAISDVRSIRTDLETAIEQGRSVELSGEEQAVLGVEEGKALKTRYLRSRNDTLVQRLNRMREIEDEINTRLGSDALDAGRCDLAL